MRQLLYASVSTAPRGRADLDAILEASRHNNAIDGVTGLLWSDRTRFIQVLEGPEVSVAQTFARISADPRHRDVSVLSDREVSDREFGSWSMAYRDPKLPSESHDERVRHLLTAAPAEVRDRFEGFIAAG